MMFTTKAYQNEAMRLVLQEANRVAEQLQLPEQLPITEANVIKAFINPFGYAYAKKAIGNVTTSRYAYYVSQGNMLSYIESPHQDEQCRRFQASHTWPISRMDTNQAYQLATQWLAAASMDVEALNRDCSVTVELDKAYVHPPAGKFVPVYDVGWSKGQRGIASVRVFTPTKQLLQLRVEDAKYILRPPLVFTNLASLLAQNPSAKSASSSTDSKALVEVPAATPIHLAAQIASADRVVCTNFLSSEDEPKVSLAVSGERVKKIVKAVSRAKRLQLGTNSMWDWQLRFYAGTNFLAAIRFQADVFLAENGEFADESGELEKLYGEL
jgi:hypothetical protein